jgi:hypothetical protein
MEVFKSGVRVEGRNMDFESMGRRLVKTSLDSAGLMFNTKLLICLM